MKRFRLFTIFLTTFLLFANAESTHPMKKCSKEDQQCNYDKNKSKSYYFMLGGAFVKNDFVNDRLEKLGYREFSPYGLSFGFGGLRRNKRIVRGHEIESIIWKKNWRY